MSLEQSVKRFERAELDEREKGRIRNPILLHLLDQPGFVTAFLPDNASLYEGFVLRDGKGHRVTQLGLIVLGDKQIDFYTIHTQRSQSGMKNMAKKNVLSAALDFAYSQYGLLSNIYSAKYNDYTKVLVVKGYILDQKRSIIGTRVLWSEHIGHIPEKYHTDRVRQQGIVFDQLSQLD